MGVRPDTRATDSEGPASSQSMAETADRGSGSDWRRLGCTVAIGLPFAVALSFVTLRLWSGAASDCERFGPGDRFGTLFFFPVLTMALWLAYAIPVVLGRRRLIVGLAIGVTIPLAIGYLFISGTGDMIRSYPQSAQVCPSGVPDWWPSWLPT